MDFQRVILVTSKGQSLSNKIKDHFFQTYQTAVNHTSPHKQTTLSCVWGFPICRLIHPQYMEGDHDPWTSDSHSDRVLIIHLSDDRPTQWPENRTAFKELLDYDGKDLFPNKEDFHLYPNITADPLLLQPYGSIPSSVKLFCLGVTLPSSTTNHLPSSPSSLSQMVCFISDLLLAFTSPSFIQAASSKECKASFDWKMHLLRRRPHELPLLDPSAQRFNCPDLEKMRCGMLCNPNVPSLIQARSRARRLACHLSSSVESEDVSALKSSLRTLLCSSQDCWITPPFDCDYGFNVYLEKAYCNYRCAFLDCGLIIIGDGTMLGPNVDIYTVTHPVDPKERATLVEFTAPVLIGMNSWIGGKTTIVAGVRIGNNVVVAAGSVVTKDVQDNMVVGGNPAKFIRWASENTTENGLPV